MGIFSITLFANSPHITRYYIRKARHTTLKPMVWPSPQIKYYKPSSKRSLTKIEQIGMTNSTMHFGRTAQCVKQVFNPPAFGWHSDWKQSCQSSSGYRVYQSKSWNGCLSLNPNNIDSNNSSNSGNTKLQARLISNTGNVNVKLSSIVIAKP